MDPTWGRGTWNSPRSQTRSGPVELRMRWLVSSASPCGERSWLSRMQRSALRFRLERRHDAYGESETGPDRTLRWRERHPNSSGRDVNLRARRVSRGDLGELCRDSGDVGVSPGCSPPVPSSSHRGATTPLPAGSLLVSGCPLVASPSYSDGTIGVGNGSRSQADRTQP